MMFAFKVLVSAVVISFASWLSGRFPSSAGFVIALPIATMLVLPLSYAEHGDAENSVLFAKSVFVSVPISLTFFIPFLLAERFSLSFWGAYFAGCLALLLGFFLHRAIVNSVFL